MSINFLFLPIRHWISLRIPLICLFYIYYQFLGLSHFLSFMLPLSHQLVKIRAFSRLALKRPRAVLPNQVLGFVQLLCCFSLVFCVNRQELSLFFLSWVLSELKRFWNFPTLHQLCTKILELKSWHESRETPTWRKSMGFWAYRFNMHMPACLSQ